MRYVRGRGHAAIAASSLLLSAIMMLAMTVPETGVSQNAATAEEEGGAAAAVGGAYVDSVTFIKQADSATAASNLNAGLIDMSYMSISFSDAESVRQAGHDVYESSGGSVYAIEVNPTDDHAAGFNPFSLQGVRYALNYVVDRDYVVNALPGAGSPMLSALASRNSDYPLVYREMTSLGLRHDLAEADRLISEALVEAGASKSGSGSKWRYDGSPIGITIFIRSDDPVRASAGEMVASNLEALGFAVKRTYGDLYDAYDTVYSTDPAAQKWHLYTASYGGSVTLYGGLVLAVFYAPWLGAVPGSSVPGAWQYQNDLLDELTFKLVFERYGSYEERAELVRAANREGIRESVIVFLASERELYPVRGGITGVVHTQDHGIVSKYTPINAQLPGNDTSLEIGVRHVAQSAWNPIGGFRDSYGYHVWSLLRDTARVYDPHNDDDVLDGRNVLVSAEAATDGPDGMIDIPEGAVFWDLDAHAWAEPPADTQAEARVTFDLEFSNWHHGQPMDLNDVLYTIWFNTEHGSLHGHEEAFVVDMRARIPGSWHTVAINVVDEDTVEIYMDGVHHEDVAGLAREAAIWASTPWEIYAAMDMMVHTGQADWHSYTARANSGNWLDMLDASDAGLILEQLHAFRDSGYVPDFLYLDADASYTNARYDAAISWIESKGHAVISNGPFYLDSLVTDPEGGGSVVQATLNLFDDPTYPFGRGHWDAFAVSQRLAGDVRVGSIASDTGGASRYGQEIRAASDLAIAHFNEYLELRGEKWQISVERLDDMTDADTLLRHLEDLNQKGIKLVNGPAIDIISPDALRYADANGMVLASCCSSVPSLAIADDSLFRLLPDQRLHGQAIAELMYEVRKVRHIIPVGIQGTWSGELLEASRAAFERMGGSSSDAILYGGSGAAPEDGGAIRAAAADLAAEADRVIEQRGADGTAVLYVGYGDGAELLKAAAPHDALGEILWFGADQNTARPNIADDPEAAEFARQVWFMAVQPTVPDNFINGEIRDHLMRASIDASPYASYAYDAVWVLGLSILSAQSADPADVRAEIIPVAMQHVGAIGSTELNENGDLLDTGYQTWMLVSGEWVEYDPPLICR